MPTLFHQRFEQRAQKAIERAFGVTVQIRRGTALTDEMTATFVDHEYDLIEHETGLTLKVLIRDYMVAVSDVVFAGGAVEPEAGMYVVEGNDEFEILPAPGRPAVELQAGGYRWLIHTKRVKVSAQ